jgi:hypothetical protein
MTLPAVMASVMLILALAVPSQRARPGAEREASMDNSITIRG